MENEDLNVINPYNLDEALKRIESLKYEDIKDDFKHFQDNKNLELRNFEYDKYIFNLDNIKFVTSTKTNEDIRDFYLLNDLSEYLISDEEVEKKEKKRKKIMIKKN